MRTVSTKSRWGVAAAVVLPAVLLTGAGCGPAATPPGAAATVETGGSTGGTGGTGGTVSLKSLDFLPESVTVQAGTRVTWRNEEPITHTVTSGEVTGIDATSGLRSGEKPDHRFDARLPERGSVFSHTFAEPGTYPYYCDIHRGMNATVVVTR